LVFPWSLDLDAWNFPPSLRAIDSKFYADSIALWFDPTADTVQFPVSVAVKPITTKRPFCTSQHHPNLRLI
jgi:hypothetical protein